MNLSIFLCIFTHRSWKIYVRLNVLYCKIPIFALEVVKNPY